MKKPSEFYQKMLEAKARKKKLLEQAQLHAEFEAHPERFIPPIPPKTDAELRLDQAFERVKEKLVKQQPGYKEAVERSIKHLNEKTEGL